MVLRTGRNDSGIASRSGTRQATRAMSIPTARYSTTYGSTCAAYEAMLLVVLASSDLSFVFRTSTHRRPQITMTAALITTLITIFSHSLSVG